MENRKLSFYTTGDSFTNLLNDLFISGEISKIISILKSGNLQKEHIKDFFQGKLKFEGDTREGDLNVIISEDFNKEEFKEKLMTAFFNKIDEENIYEVIDLKLNTELDAFLEYFNFKEIIQFVYVDILSNLGYKVANPLYKNSDGVIFKDGTFITCDYMGHKDLYEYLNALEIVDDTSWIKDDENIHVSSYSINGTIAHRFEHNFYNENGPTENGPTEEQLKTLFEYRNVLSCYGNNDNDLNGIFLKYYNNFLQKGAKYSNLFFLKKYFKDINIPNFSLNREDIKGDKIFIRTSPKKSLPGLLNSKLIDNNINSIDNAINDIQNEFNEYSNILSNNNLHYFYQEFLEGMNGVCHYNMGSRFSDKEFSYSVSDKQGDIVQGKKSSIVLDYKYIKQLKKICKDLNINQLIQLEFVISNDKLYIVQLRVLSNNYEKTVIMNTDNFENIIANGITFSKGDITVDVKDILIVESDGDSKLLLGKKALIVTSEVEFSHLLALSKSLKIPSMFKTGDIDFTNVEKVRFLAYNYNSIIQKIH